MSSKIVPRTTRRDAILNGRTGNLIPGASKGRKYVPEPLTKDEAVRLLDEARHHGKPIWAAARNRAAIVLMWRGGLRASEALAVERRDIDFDAGTVLVRDGKYGKTATVAIDPDGMTVLAEWEHERIEKGAPATGQWLQVPGRGEWTYPLMNAAIKRIAKRAGITKRMSCHQLRHTMAAHMADEKMDMRVISAQLRHESLSTTHHYINHLRPATVIEQVQRRPGFLTTTTED